MTRVKQLLKKKILKKAKVDLQPFSLIFCIHYILLRQVILRQVSTKLQQGLHLLKMQTSMVNA